MAALLFQNRRRNERGFKDGQAGINRLRVRLEAEPYLHLQTRALLSTTLAHKDFIKSLLVIPSQRLLASGSSDKTIRFWELATARCIKTVEAHGQFITSMVWGRATVGGAV